MPISLKDLQTKGQEVGSVSRGHRQVEVLDFFRANPSEAYSQSEVAGAMTKSTGKAMSPQQARQICHSLVKRQALISKQVSDNGVTRIYYALVPAAPIKGK